MVDPATQNIAIGRLQAGESQNEVARTLNVNQSTISRQWNRFQQTGPTNDSQRSGRPRIATPGQDRYTRVFHLRNRTVAHQPLQPEYLHSEELVHKRSTTGFDSMALDPEGRISERY
jgi:transposase-like protein